VSGPRPVAEHSSYSTHLTPSVIERLLHFVYTDSLPERSSKCRWVALLSVFVRSSGHRSFCSCSTGLIDGGKKQRYQLRCPGTERAYLSSACPQARAAVKHGTRPLAPVLSARRHRSGHRTFRCTPPRCWAVYRRSCLVRCRPSTGRLVVLSATPSWSNSNMEFVEQVVHSLALAPGIGYLRANGPLCPRLKLQLVVLVFNF